MKRGFDLTGYTGAKLRIEEVNRLETVQGSLAKLLPEPIPEGAYYIILA